jgi:hypothetical protein
MHHALKTSSFNSLKAMATALLGWAWSLMAIAQVTIGATDLQLTVNGEISAVTCPVTINNKVNATQSSTQQSVVNLPVLNTTALIDNAYSPLTIVELNFDTPWADALNCIALAGQSNSPGLVKLVFDSDLAAITPRTGLLRNSASTSRAASNVFVQLGLVTADGSFSPIDLNKPQTLNKALSIDSKGGVRAVNNKLTLGIRYVTSAALAGQNTAVRGTPNFAESEVSAGNVSVFLPFLLKVN